MTKHICDSEFPWCPSDAKAGDFYKLRVNDLSPTQFAVGKAEIQVRAGRMRKKYKKDPAKLHDYLRTRPIPILVRGDKFYLVDHHHLASGLYLALNETLGNDLCVYVKVLGNGSSLERAYFWKTMHQEQLGVPVRRNGGGPQAPATLPTHIKDLEHDPYRSLAWIVREHHGYLKNNAPFSEFKWANFFRTASCSIRTCWRASTPSMNSPSSVDEHGTLELNDDGKEVIDEAMFLASSAEARGLPGFRGPSA